MKQLKHTQDRQNSPFTYKRATAEDLTEATGQGVSQIALEATDMRRGL
ncbi:hypothetical protein C809_00677 [Lachnospiraceae bacterium MD335]|jgi:hypothetical protein|nr:hypothetical protein C809_00677 [Lachnospiraceae bacterium MD335]